MLSSSLRKVYHSQEGIVRSIAALEDEKLIDEALYENLNFDTWMLSQMSS